MTASQATKGSSATIITAASILLSDRKVFLIRRVDDALLFPGHWAFPGGKAEAGETPAQTAVRETKEETNLDFLPGELFVVNHFRNRKMYRYLGKWSGRVMLQASEIADFGWFDFAATLEMPFAFDYREVVDLLHAKGLID
jgi:mutator protein MutT